MPMYRCRCKACGKSIRKLLSIEVYQSGKLPLHDCGGELTREATGPTTRVVEVLDNGIMPRKVERLAEAPRMAHERAVADNFRFKEEHKFDPDHATDDETP
jgi:hypothetical protein